MYKTITTVYGWVVTSRISLLAKMKAIERHVAEIRISSSCLWKYHVFKEWLNNNRKILWTHYELELKNNMEFDLLITYITIVELSHSANLGERILPQINFR